MAYRNQGGRGGRRSRPLRVLVDMDQVIADFEGHFITVFRERFPEEPIIPLEDRTTFFIAEQYEKLGYGEETVGKVRSVIRGKGFYGSLPVIKNSLEAVKEMAGLDNTEVFLCSSPTSSTPFSASEKVEWVMEHLGKDWIDRLILTRDKTMIVGDVLIDDKPRIAGVNKPMWQHVLFSACHNRHLDIRELRCRTRLENWDNREEWMKILDDIRKDHA